MKITVVQPAYFSGNTPDKAIAEFLKQQLQTVEKDGLILLPEYSNAGGLSDIERELIAIKRADKMLEFASNTAKQKSAYVAINVLRKDNQKIKNSTFLFNKNGQTAFIYDKIHLPPSEIKLKVSYCNGDCCCELDGIRFAFMTCYDTYYNEQIEHIAKFKPDVILIPGYQGGERVDIIRAQAKLTAFRCNSYLARSSYSMNSDTHGGCSMIVAPDGNILCDMGAQMGNVLTDVDVKHKYMRSTGFGESLVRNDDFINSGIRPQIFNKY